MKRLLTLIVCILVIAFITFNTNKISNYITNRISNKQTLIIEENNAYTKDYNFLFIKNDEDYIPYSYNDLLNIIYTVINNGWDTFTFYCPSEYKECVNDIEKISKDDLILTHINNYVHPYNSFTILSTSILDSGEITVKVTHLYDDDQIEKVEKEVDRIMNEIIKDNMTDYEKIKAIHDYIINHTKYDQTANEENKNHASALAYGTLFNHVATCNGYTDTMAIFLSKLGIKNYKIATTKEDMKDSSTGHVWNAVYINNSWVHLDLTWDDPVSNTGTEYLLHKYFLVTTEEMAKADSGEVNIEEHNFNKNIYLEFNQKSQSLI